MIPYLLPKEKGGATTVERSDVLVVGSGVAGCVAALKAAECGFKVNLITKGEKPEDSNTYHAQGGIIYKGKGGKDSPELLVKDILEAGAGASLPEAARVLATEGPSMVEKYLMSLTKVPFNKDEDGDLDRTEEAAHSVRRIIHADDLTGRAIEIALIKKVLETPAIKVFTNHVAIDLLTPEHHTEDPLNVYDPLSVVGIYAYHVDSKEVKRFIANVTILATGGLGRVFLHTTNPKGATGDGFAMAYHAGARLINMEYVQFHPTTLFHRDAERFLISESVRGEGGVLLTPEGEPFMEKYHPLGSLAPRDVVARAIHQEMVENGYQYVLLDLASHMKPEAIRERFPTIYETCKRYGIDISTQPIPVVPATHFSCGGVKVDLWGRTTVDRLFAVGEVSCTGVHGANRLASTSLLEGIVWGDRCVRRIAEDWEKYESPPEYPIPHWVDTGIEDPDPALVKQDFITLKHIMWNYVGLARSRRRLQRAIIDLRHLWREVEHFYKYSKLSKELIELRHALQTGLIVAKAAQGNRTSRGCHYRID